MNLEVLKFPSAPKDVHGNETEILQWRLYADGDLVRAFPAAVPLPLQVDGDFSAETQFQFSAVNAIGEGALSEPVRGELVEGVPGKPRTDFMLRFMPATSGPRPSDPPAPPPTSAAIIPFAPALRSKFIADYLEDLKTYSVLCLSGDHPQNLSGNYQRSANRQYYENMPLTNGLDVWIADTDGVTAAGAGPTLPTPIRKTGVQHLSQGSTTIVVPDITGLTVGMIASSGYSHYRPVVQEITPTTGSAGNVRLDKPTLCWFESPSTEFPGGVAGDHIVDFMDPADAVQTDGTVNFYWSHNLETHGSYASDGGWVATTSASDTKPTRLANTWRHSFRGNDNNTFNYYQPSGFIPKLLAWDAKHGNTILTNSQRGWLRELITQMFDAMVATNDPDVAMTGNFSFVEWILAVIDYPPLLRTLNIDYTYLGDWILNRLVFFSEQSISNFADTWNGDNPATDQQITLQREMGYLLIAYVFYRKFIGPLNWTVGGFTAEVAHWLTQFCVEHCHRSNLQASLNDPASNRNGVDIQPFYITVATHRALSLWIREEVAAGRDPNRYIQTTGPIGGGTKTYDRTHNYATCSDAIVDSFYKMVTQWENFENERYFIIEGGTLEDPSTWFDATKFTFKINSRDTTLNGHPTLDNLVSQGASAMSRELATGRAASPAPGVDYAWAANFGHRLFKSAVEQGQAYGLSDSDYVTSHGAGTKQRAQITSYGMEFVWDWEEITGLAA